jgi:hypothetical protein
MTPLTQSVLQAAAQAQFTVNGNQTFEVMEAYTTVSGGICRPETITPIADAMDDIRNRVDPILRFERSSEKGG